MTKTYKLSMPFRIYNMLMIGFLTVLPPLMMTLTPGRSNFSNQVSIAIPVIWILFMAGFWYLWVLRVPFELKIHEDNSVEFRSLLKRTVVSPHEIRSIKARPLTLGFINVKHERGTISLVNHIDGFYDLVWTLKSVSPSIEVRGC